MLKKKKLRKKIEESKIEKLDNEIEKTLMP